MADDYFDRPYGEREEDRRLAVAAIRRAAVQERHSVRRELTRWADLMEHGVQQSTGPDDFWGVVFLWIPAFDKHNTLDGHFRIEFSYPDHDNATPTARSSYDKFVDITS